MKYTRREKIGSGGLGAVFRAIDQSGRIWAMKRLTKGGPKQRARFRREISIQSRLRHRHIVPVIASNRNSKVPFYIMPLADGDLEEWIPELAGNADAIQRLAGQLMDGLAYAHGQHVLHRDLKPANVLRYGEDFRIADFGLGKVMGEGGSCATSTADRWRTRWYAAPEQLIGLS